jgi:hypothetical protein
MWRVSTDRDRRQQRVELEEILLVDQHGVPVLARHARSADRPCHVEPAETAAEDDEPSSRHGAAA